MPEQQERGLGALGIGADDEAVYRAVIADPRASIAQMATTTRLRSGEVRRALASLTELGLLTRRRDRRAPRTVPPPDVALEPLIAQRQQEIERVRLTAFELLEEVRRGQGRRGPTELFEVVVDPDTIQHRFFQMLDRVKREVLGFDRPPYLAAGRTGEHEIAMLRSGVRFRVVYDRTSLEFPGQRRLMRAVMAEGEEARVATDVPMKLFVFDRETAFTPLFDDTPHEGIAVIHRSALLSALIALFEATWNNGMPIDVLDGSTTASRHDEQRNELLMLLAAGLKDEAIARQLDVNVRTARRRIKNLMDDLHVSTRFQAGLRAAKDGLL